MTIRLLEDETELLSKIAKGDHFAFKVLYELYDQKIYKFSFKIMGSRESAEEVLQETMLYVWQQGNKLKNISNIEGYLKIVAKHKAIDAFRKQVLHNKVQQAVGSAYDDVYQMVEENTVLSTGRELLEEGIKRLPAQQREVYQLCYQQGLKYEQVAEKLQISHGTVQTHMKLALKFLRGYIRNHADVLALVVIFRLFEK